MATGDAANAGRLRRPFRKAARKPKRNDVQWLVEAVYGPDLPHFLGSPYEGRAIDGTEIALHELAHAVQIPGLEIVPGALAWSWEAIDRYLWALPPEASDEHEVGAITITLRVAKSLTLPLERPPLARAGARNCRADHDVKNFERRVEQAWTTPLVLEGAQLILNLLDQAWVSGV